MKRTLILSNTFFVFMLLLSCNRGNEQAKYNINLENSTTAPIKAELQLIMGNNIKKLDSVSVAPGEKQSFKGTLAESSFFRIEINDETSAILAVDTKPLSVLVQTAGNDELSISTQGNELQKNFETIRSLQSLYEKQKDSLNKAYILAENTGNFPLLENLQKAFEAAYFSFENKLKQEIKKQDKTIVSVYACSLLDPGLNMAFFDSLSTQFSESEQQNSIVKEFTQAVKKQNSTKIGGKAPDFTGNTPDGRKVSLKDFKGKVVLLDFWASWCIPCRRANPEVVKLYESLKGKNFEIIGISLDTQADKWKAAIVDDKLTWQHVSDLGGWDSEFATLYNVEEIPQTFLLNTEGVIVAKNLRGEALKTKIDELLQDTVN